MELTLAMLLYFIRHMNPVIFKMQKGEHTYIGIKQFFPEDADASADYLYICELADLWVFKDSVTADMTVLASGNAGLTKKELEEIPCNLILVSSEYKTPYILNQMISVFGRMSNWDKSMHIAALEGKPLQELVDISEDILEHPIIVFDASFDVLAYTKHLSDQYEHFKNTLQHGYTDPKIMEQVKKHKILSRLENGGPLVAPAAGDASQTNIYLSFYSNQKLLGYACVNHSDTQPEQGYLDVLRYFTENVNFCLKRDYDNHRSGQMMYETFLVNLMNSAGISAEQVDTQIKNIENLTRKGRFVLGVFEFTGEEKVPIDFVARILEQNMWDVKVYIYEGQICLLRVLSPDAITTPVIVESETQNIKKLLSNYEFIFGISSVFYDILDLRHAYTQARVAMEFGTRDGKQFCLYQDYYYHHMFSLLDQVMPVEHLKSEVYQQLQIYDRDNHTNYLRTLLAYLECDCNATHAAEKLFVHRNTVRNAVQFVEDKWKIDLNDVEEKKRISLSSFIDEYKK